MRINILVTETAEKEYLLKFDKNNKLTTDKEGFKKDTDLKDVIDTIIKSITENEKKYLMFEVMGVNIND